MATRKTPPLDLPKLFAGAMKMADEVTFADLTLERIARNAKVPVSRLRTQFVDLTHFLIALQQSFLDAMRDDVISMTANHPPGLERVRSATIVYLDCCLRVRGLRGWLLEARRDEPLIAEGLRRQNHSFALIISTEFHALGWPHPLAAARLFLAAIQEAARLEQIKGEPLPFIREAIWDIARFYTGQVKAGVAR